MRGLSQSMGLSESVPSGVLASCLGGQRLDFVRVWVGMQSNPSIGVRLGADGCPP